MQKRSFMRTLGEKQGTFWREGLNMKYDTVLVLDFGGQYCHLIGRRIREFGVYSEIVPYDIKTKEIKLLNAKFNVKGLVLSGGPASVFDECAPKLDVKILDLGLSVLGLCYGHQLIAQMAGGRLVG